MDFKALMKASRSPRMCHSQKCPGGWLCNGERQPIEIESESISVQRDLKRLATADMTGSLAGFIRCCRGSSKKNWSLRRVGNTLTYI